MSGGILVTNTEMLPTLIVCTLYVLASAGLLYMVERHKNEYPYDLIVGFFSMSLWFTLAIQWYSGWSDYVGNGMVSITNYYMASWTGIVAMMVLVIWLFQIYRYVFHESRDVSL